MNSLLSNSQWLGDQLSNLIQVLKERQNKFSFFLVITNTSQNPKNEAIKARNTIFIDPKQDSICYYSGTISSSPCLKKLSKRTTQIIKIFENSINLIKNSYFYSIDIELRLEELKFKINGMIIDKSVNYFEYLEAILGYSRSKINLQIDKVEEFYSKNRNKDIGVEYLAGLVENVLNKQEKKRRPVSVGKIIRREVKDKDKQQEKKQKQRQQSKQKNKNNERNNVMNNIFTNYGLLDLSKTQFNFYIDFNNQPQHKQKLLMILSERNKHIKQQIKVHIEDVQQIDEKIRMIKSSSVQLPNYNNYQKSIQFFHNTSTKQIDQQPNPQKLKKSSSNPRRRSISQKKSKITNFEFQFTSPLKKQKQSKSNYLSIGNRIMSNSIKSRSHTKIVKSRVKPEDSKEIFEPKKLSNREFRNKINETKLFLQNYSMYNDPSLFNHTVPVKNLRMKRHVKVNLIQSVKLSQ